MQELSLQSPWPPLPDLCIRSKKQSIQGGCRQVWMSLKGTSNVKSLIFLGFSAITTCPILSLSFVLKNMGHLVHLMLLSKQFLSTSNFVKHSSSGPHGAVTQLQWFVSIHIKHNTGRHRVGIWHFLNLALSLSGKSNSNLTQNISEDSRFRSTGPYKRRKMLSYPRKPPWKRFQSTVRPQTSETSQGGVQLNRTSSFLLCSASAPPPSSAREMWLPGWGAHSEKCLPHKYDDWSFNPAWGGRDRRILGALMAG